MSVFYLVMLTQHLNDIEELVNNFEKWYNEIYGTEHSLASFTQMEDKPHDSYVNQPNKKKRKYLTYQAS